jgi:hypothetical protein
VRVLCSSPRVLIPNRSIRGAIEAAPALTFTKRETFGYGLNGKAFLVSGAESYDKVKDSYMGTTAAILRGSNRSARTLFDGRVATKTVNAGWTSKKDEAARTKRSCTRNSTGRNAPEIAGNVLTLRGMAAALGSDATDVYTLSMRYDMNGSAAFVSGGKGLCIATKDENGSRVNAVDLNTGGTKKRVSGPWRAGFGLGTYGMDPKTHTAWTVINRNGEFVVAESPNRETYERSRAQVGNPGKK